MAGSLPAEPEGAGLRRPKDKCASKESDMWDRRRTARAGFIRGLAAVGFATGGIAAATVAAPPDGVRGGDWPTYRHDSALSAVSPLKGGLGQPPRVAWSVDLGGPRIPS